MITHCDRRASEARTNLVLRRLVNAVGLVGYVSICYKWYGGCKEGRLTVENERGTALAGLGSIAELTKHASPSHMTQSRAFGRRGFLIVTRSPHHSGYQLCRPLPALLENILCITGFVLELINVAMGSKTPQHGDHRNGGMSH